MKRNFKVNHVILSVLIAISLVACGGGSSSSSGISYTGLTTEATIDENNARDLSTGAYQGGQTGSAFNSVGVIQAGESEPVGYLRMLKVSQILEDSINQVDLMSISNNTFAGAVYTESDTIYGDCGGSASLTMSANDQTGDITGDFNFSNYCDDGVSMSGSANFSAHVDLNTDELVEFSFSFDNLSMTLGSDSFTLDGSMIFDVSTSSVTMTMYLADNSTGEVFWIENYSMTITEGAGYVDAEISGRYYAPDYGYVTIATPTPLRIYDGDAYPTSGVFVITGSTGVSESTKARLTALSSATYQIEADTNGDGTYDWDSGVLNWLDI